MHLLGVFLITFCALLNASSVHASNPGDDKKDAPSPKHSNPAHEVPTHPTPAHPHHNKKTGPQVAKSAKSASPSANVQTQPAPSKVESPVDAKSENKNAIAFNETAALNWPNSHEKDAVILQMAEAFARGDKSRLTALLPQVLNHPLAPWAAYWELKARLEEASIEEVRAFLQTYANTYQFANTTRCMQ